MGASSPRPVGPLAMTLDKPLFLFQHDPELKSSHSTPRALGEMQPLCWGAGPRAVPGTSGPAVVASSGHSGTGRWRPSPALHLLVSPRDGRPLTLGWS